MELLEKTRKINKLLQRGEKVEYNAIAETVWDTTDPTSAEFQEAGNWVGILFAVQAVGSVLWAIVLPQFKNAKMAYALSLAIGAIGFCMIPFLHDQYMQFIPFLMVWRTRQ